MKKTWRAQAMILGNCKMDCTEIVWGWNGLDSSSLGQGPMVGSCEHCNEPLDSIKLVI